MEASNLQQSLIDQAWAAVTRNDLGTHPTSPGPVEVTGESGRLPSRFAVEEVAVASVSAALLAAGALNQDNGGIPALVRLDRGHVAYAVRSERYFYLRGRRAAAGFAPLSRFWRAADGWVRTHANYPWHRSALLRALGTSEDVDAVAAAMAKLSGKEVEQSVFEAGGIATAVRTIDTWLDHPQGQALTAEPLIGHRMTQDGTPRHRTANGLPMAEVRVLDLTRVIAGPVCTRFLAALGARVLRIDPPDHPDMPAATVTDTLIGKRSSFVDLKSAEGSATLEHLLSSADVVVCGYRPGALDRFGLDEGSLAERHSGIVVVYLDAWGHRGPWAARRGFDSVVQAPTGIAVGESPADGEPGALPCQLLDHATGYLAAAAVLDGLRRQGVQGGTHVRRLSLARTALWLTSQGTRRKDVSAEHAKQDPSRWLTEVESADGPVTVVAPPGALGERALRWPTPLTGYAIDSPTWPEVPG